MKHKQPSDFDNYRPMNIGQAILVGGCVLLVAALAAWALYDALMISAGGQP